MFSKAMLMAVLEGSIPAARGSADSSFGVLSFSDDACTVPTTDANGLAQYELLQVPGDQHCYAHKSYSIKLSCDKDDTVRVDHWLDATGKGRPCSGEMLAGEPLMKDVPWEIAVEFFRGHCTWSSEHGAFGMLTEPLPYNGYPTCDSTGASIRRLSAGNNTNATNGSVTPAPVTPAPATPTPPTPTPPTPVPTASPNASGNNTTSNASDDSNLTTTKTTTELVATVTGVASGASIVNYQVASLTGIAAALVAAVVV